MLGLEQRRTGRCTGRAIHRRGRRCSSFVRLANRRHCRARSCRNRVASIPGRPVREGFPKRAGGGGRRRRGYVYSAPASTMRAVEHPGPPVSPRCARRRRPARCGSPQQHATGRAVLRGGSRRPRGRILEWSCCAAPTHAAAAGPSRRQASRWSGTHAGNPPSGANSDLGSRARRTSADEGFGRGPRATLIVVAAGSNARRDRTTSSSFESSSAGYFRTRSLIRRITHS